MQKTYRTSRLELAPLNESDGEFIFELLNSEGWLKYIGDRNIKTLEDSGKYIQKTLENTNINYWVVRKQDGKISIGIISLVKRDYLAYHDVGFAFLPAFLNKGYAFEASEIVLKDLLEDPKHPIILATTMAENNSSIKLLKKLGFFFNKEIENDTKKLFVYSVTPADFFSHYKCLGKNFASDTRNK